MTRDELKLGSLTTNYYHCYYYYYYYRYIYKSWCRYVPQTGALPCQRSTAAMRGGSIPPVVPYPCLLLHLRCQALSHRNAHQS